MKDICQRNHKGADTSVTAHQSIAGIKDSIAEQVLGCIRFFGMATCEDVESHLALSHQTASARISELKKKGLVYDSAIRQKTRSGRSARVYFAIGEI